MDEMIGLDPVQIGLDPVQIGLDPVQIGWIPCRLGWIPCRLGWIPCRLGRPGPRADWPAGLYHVFTVGVPPKRIHHVKPI
eukprot:353532-Chlamydomonas_euryale.AAC.11